MNIHTLGIVLHYYRVKYKLNAMDICGGICSQATYYRIEQGCREGDSLLNEVLLGRIGQEVSQFELIIDEKDYERWKTRNKIIEFEEKEQLENIKDILEKYKTLIPEYQSLHLQFIDYFECLLKLENIKKSKRNEKEKNKQVREINQILYHALSYSKPNFHFEEENEVLYSSMEIKIILLLLHYNYTEWEYKNKETELLKILDFVKKYYSEREKEKISIKIISELVRQAQKQKEDEKVIKYCDDAIELISQGRGVKDSAFFHFTKAKILGKKYIENNNSRNIRKDCMEECLMAYYVYDIMNQIQEKDEVKKYCEEVLGWHIIKQEILFD